MKWVDVAGPPGAGKSALCYPIWRDKSVTWDGSRPPASWKLFLEEMTHLMELVKDHPSITAVLRMNDRSAKKMATVYRMRDDSTFIQTGWLQRVLGFGWRLQDMGRDINLIRPALWRMPVSVGVVVLEADLETILARNRAREKVQATAHENRSYQVPRMLPSIDLAKRVLVERGVPVKVINVEKPIEVSRHELVEFSRGPACEAGRMANQSEADLISLPGWWQDGQRAIA